MQTMRKITLRLLSTAVFIFLISPSKGAAEVATPTGGIPIGLQDAIRGTVGTMSMPADWTNKSQLNADDAAAEAGFGSWVDVDGDTAVVGSVYDSPDLGSGELASAGSAYVYVRDASGNWIQQAKLNATDAQAYDQFGASVAISGDTIVVGAFAEDPDLGSGEIVDAGSAYVFVRDGLGFWAQQAKLSAADPKGNAYFGFSLDISGDTVVVGAFQDWTDLGEGVITKPGSAYVFERTGTTWVQQAKIRADDAENFDWFGVSVGIDRDTIVVGAGKESPDIGSGPITRAGSAYVFSRSGFTWSQQRKLSSPWAQEEDGFGLHVAIDGNLILVGAQWANPDIGGGPLENGGMAFLYEGSFGNWGFDRSIVAEDAVTGALFGSSVEIEGKTIIIGAVYDDPDPGGGPVSSAGSAYTYVSFTGTWFFQGKLMAPDPMTTDLYGFSVAYTDGQVLVAAPRHDPDLGGGEITDAGSVFSYTLELIVDDNNDAEFSASGPWQTFTGAKSIYNYYQTSTRLKSGGNGSATATFQPNIPALDTYEVFLWLDEHPYGATNMPVTVNFTNGSKTVYVDVSNTPVDGGWVSLGIYLFDAGTDGSVVVSDDADGVVIADAVKWQKADFSCEKQDSIPLSECEALVAFTQDTFIWGDISWNGVGGWLATGDPCFWSGVSCDGGHVVSLDFENWYIYGPLTTEIGNLPYLTELDLTNNSFYGPVPTEIGNLTNLIRLRLSQNDFTGVIPTELGNLTNLQELWIGHNQLTGGIPPELGNLIELRLMFLEFNPLGGTLPPELGNLSKLELTSFYSNQLTGSIPPEFGNLSALQYLGLDNNQLSGEIPPELGQLNNVSHFVVSRNQLAGSIPPEIGNLTNLQNLIIYDNLLSGPLPSSMTSLTNLGFFDFHNTDLCEPEDPAFQSWLASVGYVSSTGVLCISTPTPTATFTPTATMTPTASPTSAGGSMVNQVVDDQSGGFAAVGAWTTYTKAQANYDFYLNAGRAKQGGNGSATGTFTPDLPESGEYEVFAWLDRRADGATNLPFTIYHSGGSTIVTVNTRTQPPTNGGWVSLGSYSFPAGASGQVVVSDDATGGWVIADAVRWYKPGAPTDTPTPTNTIDAPAIVTLDNASLPGGAVVGGWMQYTNAQTGGYQFYGGNGLLKTAGLGTSTVTFQPGLPKTATYEVFVWVDRTTYGTTDMRVEVHHAGGTATVYVNFQTAPSSGGWVSLGSYTFNAGTGGYVVVTDQAGGGYVIADAVRWVEAP